MIDVKNPPFLGRRNVFPPHPTHGIRAINGCRGLPAGNVGRDGDLATDPTTGKLYLKSAGAWAFHGQGFDRLYGGGPVDSLICVNGDPSSGPYVFELDIRRFGNSVQLYWWALLSNGHLLGTGWDASESLALDMKLYVQRSSSKINHPLDPDWYDLDVGYSAFPGEADWQTIKQFNPGDVIPLGTGPTAPMESFPVAVPVPWQTFYQDDDPFPNGVHVANYRALFVNNSPGGGAYAQFDWNVSTAIKGYAVTATQNAGGVLVSWV